MTKEKTVFLFIFILSFSIMNGQDVRVGFSKGIDKRNYFIENKALIKPSDVEFSKNEIEFIYIGAKEKYYFTKQGVIIEWQKEVAKGMLAKIHKLLISKELIEEMEREGEFSKQKTYSVMTSWVGSNKNTVLLAENKTSHYYTFATSNQQHQAYNKITYINIYPNIDIEYIIPEDSSGIKYNIIAHAGADLTNLRLSYSGDVKLLKNNDVGSVVITTKDEDFKITEHAPIAYYKTAPQTKIPSSFRIDSENKSFSFQLSNFDVTKEIIIDPWISTTAVGTLNIAYDVDFDNSGNLFAYVIGSLGNYVVSKYSPLGILQWSHNVAFTSFLNDGNFLVEKNTGKTYITEGFNPSFGAGIYRISPTGVPDGFNAIPSTLELWDLGFNCATNEILAFGGEVTSNRSISVVNTTTGVLSAFNFTGNTGIAQDVVSFAIDNQGRLFTVLASLIGTPAVNNHLIHVNPNFTSSVYNIPTGYTTFIEAGNHPASNPSNPSSSVATQFNGLAINDTYLIYYDGINLKAFNPTTGASLGAITIAGHVGLQQAGVAIDDCNNVYIGGNNGTVLYYNFNGTSFTPLGTINLGWTSASKNVHDIKYDRSTNLLYISGRGNVAVVTALASINCSLLSTVGNCNAPGTGTVTTTLNSPIANPIITYTWTDSLGTIVSQTNGSTLLSNTATGLNAGNYYVTIQLNAPCGPIFKDSITLVCSCVSVILTNDTVCAGAIVPATVFVSVPTGATFAWTNSNPSIGLAANGTGNIPSFTAINTSNIVDSAIITVTPTLGACVGTPSIYIIYVSQNPTANFNFDYVCFGTATTFTDASLPNGGVIANWSWDFTNNGTVDDTIQNPTNGYPSSGTYIVKLIVTSKLGCVDSIAKAIVVNPVPSVNFSPFNACFNTPTQFIDLTQINTLGTLASWVWNFGNSGDTSTLQNPTYMFSVAGTHNISLTVTSDSGCTSTTILPLTVNLSPDFILTTIEDTCVSSRGTILTDIISGTPPFSYLWTRGDISKNLTNVLAGIYSLTVVDSNNCSKNNSIEVGNISSVCNVLIPNIITPNGDEMNDNFVIVNLEFFPNNNVVIFNRWGKKIFETNGYKNDWDGEDYNDGTYFYIIELNDKANTVHKGTLTILR